ncbi:MAG: DNA repair protein RadA [Chlamydiae bacterium]|jgi:DNA repair protein RadA/Sms|nr:DNA repair protein RadA [Chlamydiota bacterium]
MKQKESWVCSECGHDQAKWSGSCSACKRWNTIEKFIEVAELRPRFMKAKTRPMPLKEIVLDKFDKIQTELKEFDRVLGGGIVQGSLNLIGGDPGVGKSTLMLMIAKELCKSGKKVLYVCGEESLEQTKNRADRLSVAEDQLYLYCETLFSNIKAQVEELQPDALIIDSIQIVYKPEIASLPGSVIQVKEIAMECMHIAKQMGITSFVIGHVTKSGDLAGPRVLEHIVDVVLDFEGDPDLGLRILRARKNRFGPTDEVAMFQMGEKGLEEVANPSQIFLKERVKEATGSCIVPTMEGTRAILIEIQALVAASAFSTCARRASGIDPNRLALLLAVLEKRVGHHFHHLDVFVSVAGGLRIREPAIDLAIALAIASSFSNRPIDPHTIVLGEIGLGGELRSVPRVESRIKEAKHMGFKRCILPKKSLPKEMGALELVGVERLEEAIEIILK